ncbi:MAG TPA: LamG domain-containing protein, partial [Nitrosopumilaceae archaeon]|nr:LamG domain-containing protein [Nitrosopumilaceae archaeon]
PPPVVTSTSNNPPPVVTSTSNNPPPVVTSTSNNPPPVVTSTSNNPINNLSSNQNNTNNEISTLNSPALWELKPSEISTAQGDVIVENNNKNSLTLSGSGFLKENVVSTKNLSKLTLSVWVKPDYSQGSPQFTAISKENSFNLGIYNNIKPTRAVAFSIFDGIKWQSTNSTVEIPEDWTHIVGTFDGTHISIYVNGHKESTSPISDVPTISVNGNLATKNVDTISSDADVVVGASLNSVRGTTYNLFSGSLEDAKIYDSLLSDSQISELYHQSIHSNN